MGLVEYGTGGKKSGVREVSSDEDLFTLDARLTGNYLEALDALGVEAPDGHDSLADYLSENSLPLAIDSTGYSPGLACVLGDDYLGEHLVLVSPAQFRDNGGNVRTATIRSNTGLSDALEAATSAYRNLVISSLSSEPLIISVQQTLAGIGGSYDLTALLDSLSTGTMRFSLLEKRVCLHEMLLEGDTPNGSAEKAKRCVDLLQDIDPCTLDDYLLGEKRDELERAAEDMTSLGEHYDLDDFYRLANTETSRRFPLERPFRYSTETEEGNSIIVDVIPEQEAFLVHVSGRIRVPKDAPIPVIPRSDTGRLLDSLYDAGYVQVEIGQALDMLHARGLDVLRSLDYPERELEQYESNLMMLHHELGKDDVKEHLTEEWFALRDMYLMLKEAKADGYLSGSEEERLCALYSKLSPESKLGASVLSENTGDRMRSMIKDWLPELF